MSLRVSTRVWTHREEENFIFPITIHPDVSGYVLPMVLPLIYLLSLPDALNIRSSQHLHPQPSARPPNARKSCFLPHRLSAKRTAEPYSLYAFPACSCSVHVVRP